MIVPTVGRVVWFYHYVPGQGHKGPLAAHVCDVSSDADVNLFIIGQGGQSRPGLHVKLLQDGEPAPEHDYCCWMPYQKGQVIQVPQLDNGAPKTEALEKEAKVKELEEILLKEDPLASGVKTPVEELI